jgi:uncharacterized protein YfiM (DUF2279 family)
MAGPVISSRRFASINLDSRTGVAASHPGAWDANEERMAWSWAIKDVDHPDQIRQN